MKTHIKMNSTRTFCGKQFNIWRNGKNTFGQPMAKEELPTAKPGVATCKGCGHNFWDTMNTQYRNGQMKEFVTELKQGRK